MPTGQKYYQGCQKLYRYNKLHHYEKEAKEGGEATDLKATKKQMF